MSVRQGNNTIAGATNYIPDLLDWKWADHILDNISWLRGDTFSWQAGTVYTRVYSHLLSDTIGKTLQTETVAGYTVSFYLADDGHKVCPADQESVVASIFNRLGEAWYYILDTTNQRFKLPRKKDTSIKEVYNGTDGITILSNGLVIQKKPNRTGSEWWPNLNLVDTSRPVGASAASYGAAYAGERTMYFGTEWNGTEFISHARENYSGPSGTLYGATLISYATDEQISVFIGGTFRADTSEKFLYFYVGRFTQSAVAQTAGLNTELLNNKVDLDGNNASFAHIVETYNDGNSWYRVYSDGWCEQGGLSNGGGGSFVTTTFLKPFVGTSYNIVTALLNDENNSTCFGVKIANRTASSFQSRTWYSSGNAGDYNFNWRASGYIA